MRKPNARRDRLLTAKRERRRITLRNKHRRANRQPVPWITDPVEEVQMPKQKPTINLNPVTWYRWFKYKQIRSWVGHGVVTAGIGLVLALFLCAFFPVFLSPLGVLLSFSLCSSGVGSYYIFYREPRDRLLHRLAQHGDVSYEADPGPVHYEIDGFGDSIGPGFVAGTSWLLFLFLLVVDLLT